jgi:hypothetical protein
VPALPSTLLREPFTSTVLKVDALGYVQTTACNAKQPASTLKVEAVVARVKAPRLPDVRTGAELLCVIM